MTPIAITHFTLASCLGRGVDAHRAALQAGRSGLKPCDFDTVDIDTWIGEVDGLASTALRPDLAALDCRNNRLIQIGLENDGFPDAVRAALARYGADRVGVFIGTSTSGMLQTELAYRERDASGALPASFHYATSHNAYSGADFVCAYFGLTGPAMVLSAACASSAKAFGNAQRMLAAGLIDAAIVGGADSLCLTTLYGFRSLELTSSQPCRPFDAERDGISIGEAAAFTLLERADAASDTPPGERLYLLGVGESSDAHHMSSPHPEGRSAKVAIQQALDQAGLRPDQIGYINLHGTGTPSNDASESQAVAAVFGAPTPPCSSTKGATGHTLGAAGALEAIVSLLALRHRFLPAGLNVGKLDPALPVAYQRRSEPAPIQHVLSNSFGFGGANCSIVFGRGGR